MGEYYQERFASLHATLASQRKAGDRAPQVRAEFWDLIPDGRYLSDDARPLVQAYARRVEGEIAAVVSRHSLAYWLHVYRRIAPHLPDADPATGVLTRRSFEAAIQKYSKEGHPIDVVNSAAIDPREILDGAFKDPQYASFVEALRARPQLVLPSFTIDHLVELYDAENLAHELWRCAATLRILGKGAALNVAREHQARFFDDRNEELNALVQSFDKRNHGFEASATGTVFTPPHGEPATALLPHYDVTRAGAALLRDVAAKAHKSDLEIGGPPNFVWLPFLLRSFHHAHAPFAEAFDRRHGVSLTAVIAVVAALLARALLSWRDDLPSLVRHWQRAYDGPYSTRAGIEREVRQFLEAGLASIGSDARPSDVDVPAAMDFWTCKRDQVDVSLGGPMAMLLQSGEECWFLDYAWLSYSLYTLFFGVHPDNENFKGLLLEEVIDAGRSVLPGAPCRLPSGIEREIDAALEVGDTLILAECKVFGRSFGFERGDPIAIAFRTNKVEAAIREADDKAARLAEAPVGANYDISRFRRIVPIAVTPFVEYLPSRASWYWLTADIPRVMTPRELAAAIDAGVFRGFVQNELTINH
jgi:hypothetical protein